jgi:hypothetical protein
MNKELSLIGGLIPKLSSLYSSAGSGDLDYDDVREDIDELKDLFNSTYDHIPSGKLNPLIASTLNDTPKNNVSSENKSPYDKISKNISAKSRIVREKNLIEIAYGYTISHPWNIIRYYIILPVLIILVVLTIFYYKIIQWSITLRISKLRLSEDSVQKNIKSCVEEYKRKGKLKKIYDYRIKNYQAILREIRNEIEFLENLVSIRKTLKLCKRSKFSKKN